MRRRITVAVVAVALGAVALAGLGTTLLSWHQTRTATAADLEDEARALEPFVTREFERDLAARRIDPRSVEQRVRNARRALKLAGASALVVDDENQVLAGSLPDGVDAAAVVGTTVDTGARSGRNRDLIWAAASGPAGDRGMRVVVVLTTRIHLATGALPWVALSGIVAAAVAIVAATLVARRLVEPVQQLEVVTSRIAAGDLEARAGPRVAGSAREICALADSVDAMASSLGHARQSERDFLLSISHDLRTPLTSMRGYAEAIVDGVAPDPSGAAQVILSESTRLERLVADLLDLARLESRRFSLQIIPLDLREAARLSIGGFLPTATEAGVTLAAAVDDAPVLVDGDPDRLAQVLANLIENAMAFAETEVRVEVSADLDVGRIRVVDDGPGIEPGNLDRVFERHFVARHTPSGDDPRPGGTGLGLAIARELVHAMGGTIGAHDGSDSGTVVEVRLPRHRPSD